MVSVPLDATLNTVTELLSCPLTKSLLSSGLKTATLELVPGPLKGAPAIRVSAPVGPILKTSTWEFGMPPRATKSCVPAQLKSMPAAPVSVVGDPGTGVNTPVAEILKTAMLPGDDVTARNLASEVTLALTNGPTAPLAKGEPATGVRAPLAAILKTLIVMEDPFATIRNLSSGVVVNDIPFPSSTPPVANGEPGTEVRTPVA